MLQGIEGLRAIGAFSVAISHSWDSPIRASAWFNGSFLVVDMFFVLSGYLVTMVYAERATNWRQGGGMIFNRLGRLYPTHILLLGLLLLLLNLKMGLSLLLSALGIDAGMTPVGEQPEIFDLRYFLLTITLLHGVGIDDSDLFNFASWSISAEFWAFVTLTSCFVLTRGRRRRIVFGIGAVALCIAFYLACWWQPATHSFDASRLLDRNLARSVMAYFVGMLAFELRGQYLEALSDRVIGALQAITLLTIGLVICNQPWLFMSQIWSLPVWAALIISLSYGRGWAVSVLGCAPMVWLGERSYGIYMVHSIVIIMIKHRVLMIGNPSLRTAMLLPYLAVVVVLGHLLYRYVEMPAAAWMKQRVRAYRARPAQDDRGDGGPGHVAAVRVSSRT